MSISWNFILDKEIIFLFSHVLSLYLGNDSITWHYFDRWWTS